jgi:AcrR family transcriptional regulator
MALARSDRARREVLEATAALVGEVGVERVTIDEVAQRSGVAKTTIYRHWPTKQTLVVEAVKGCIAPLPTPNSGDLRRDLLACFESMIQSGLDGRVGAMYASLLDAAQRDAELDSLMRSFQDERRLTVRTVLQLAQARGELPADLDLDFGVTLLVGPLIYTKIVLGRPVTRRFLESVVDGVLGGLRAGLVTPAAP